MNCIETSYPLVNCHIAIDNHHFSWENALISMVIFNSYVRLLEGIADHIFLGKSHRKRFAAKPYFSKPRRVEGRKRIARSVVETSLDINQEGMDFS